MAGPNDFTGQFISSTYQRLLQVSSSGEITDGTGSLVNITSGTTFNNFTSSYYIDSASFVANIFKERRYDSSGSYSYCGKAPKDTLETDSTWFITRLFISSSGNTTVASASMVDWTNRYTHTYY